MKRILILTICLALSAPAARQALAEDFGGGDIHYEKPVTGVLFSHDVHVGDMGFDCDSCHDGLFEMEALSAQQSPDFTMKGLEDGLYCGACHDGSMAFASNTRCASCHEGAKGYNKALGITDTGHEQH